MAVENEPRVQRTANARAIIVKYLIDTSDKLRGCCPHSGWYDSLPQLQARWKKLSIAGGWDLHQLGFGGEPMLDDA